MNCALCGEVCCCPSEPVSSASSPVAALESTTTALEGTQKAAAGELDSSVESGVASESASEAAAEVADAPAWRDELSARLSRYRARRTPSVRGLPARPTTRTERRPRRAKRPTPRAEFSRFPRLLQRRVLVQSHSFQDIRQNTTFVL